MFGKIRKFFGLPASDPFSGSSRFSWRFLLGYPCFAWAMFFIGISAVVGALVPARNFWIAKPLLFPSYLAGVLLYGLGLVLSFADPREFVWYEIREFWL